jgi:CRISPR-associated protein Cas6
MNTVDLSFPVFSQSPLPVDHGYLLYSALCHKLPELHELNQIAVHPLRGQYIGNRQMQVTDLTRLTLRTVTDLIPTLIRLTGKELTVSNRTLRIGVPQVQAILPVESLRSRLVTTKNGEDVERFQTELRRQLSAMKVSEEALLTVKHRRTLRIRDKEIVGHEVHLERLLSADSLVVQETGLGGRRHMGCGIFVPRQRIQGGDGE